MVYFNRYFIHESLLVAISLGIILLAIKYSQNRRLVTAIYLGICIGLLIATKETWVLYMSALVLSFVILHWVQKDFTSLTTKHLILGISAVGIIITILFSSFFTNWPGMVSFTESFQKYFIRGTTTPEHTHPWYYYIKLLFFYNEGERWFFSETAVLALAIPGIIAGTRRQYGLISLFVTSYFIIFLMAFSLIPYKTPWNILGLIPAMAILAGMGYSFIRETYKPNKYLFNAICIILLIFLVNQSCEINYRYSDSPDNPYTYGHARESVKQVSNELDKFRKIYPDLEDVRIDVIAKNGSYWPLPWYLREYPHIAWRDDIPDNIASVPIVLITPDQEPDFISQIYEKTPFEKRNLYLPIFKDDIELRPGVMIRGYMHKTLWEKILANSSGE